jgi:hypothetical protein
MYYEGTPFLGVQARSIMLRASAAWFALVCAGAVLSALPARADVAEANALSTGLLAPANASLQRVLASMKDAREQIGQVNPVGIPQAPVGFL